MATTTTPAATTTRHRLHNAHGWVLTYIVRGERVELRRSYRGDEVGALRLSRLQAREHYRRQRAEGFETAAGGL